MTRAHEQIAKEVLPVKTSDFLSPATRPANSALNCEHFCATFGIQLPVWEKALELAMEVL
jgi:dTDP-4-dehydrorhamnose reductase